MRKLLLPAMPCLVLFASVSWAAKPSREFRAAFERTFQPKVSHAVVMLGDIPAASIHGQDDYGMDADRDTNRVGTYSVDVRGGAWEASRDFNNADQDPVSELNRGEVMRLTAIAYRRDRIELRLVSLAEHPFQRGALFKREVREPVSTNFKFFLSALENRELTPDDLPAVSEAIERTLKFFPDESRARDFAARMPATGTTSPALEGSKGAEGATLALEATEGPEAEEAARPAARIPAAAATSPALVGSKGAEGATLALEAPEADEAEEAARPAARMPDAAVTSPALVGSKGAEGAELAPEATGTSNAATREIRAGMTPLQVIDTLGRPERKTASGDRQLWKYPELEVVFEKGRVTAIRF